MNICNMVNSNDRNIIGDIGHGQEPGTDSGNPDECRQIKFEDSRHAACQASWNLIIGSSRTIAYHTILATSEYQEPVPGAPGNYEFDPTWEHWQLLACDMSNFTEFQQQSKKIKLCKIDPTWPFGTGSGSPGNDEFGHSWLHWQLLAYGTSNFMKHRKESEKL